MTRHPAAPLLACLLAGALAGCVTGSSPPTRYYTLGPAASGGGNPGAGAFAYAVAVGPVTVPETVDRPQLVLRAAANRLEVADFDRWAAPLKTEIARVIAINLGSGLAGARVATVAQSAGAEPDYRVTVDVQRFESVRGEAAALEALWTVRRRGEPRPTEGRFALREPVRGAGYEALVEAHGRALAALSEAIAAAIRAARSAAGNGK